MPHNPKTFLYLVLALLALGLGSHANAGSVYFSLDRTQNNLVVTNRGNSSAFYPQVLRLNASGQWEKLAPLPGANAPAELAPNAQFTVHWGAPPANTPAAGTPLDVTQPIMMRFFDQAGAGFGQISFFNQPPNADVSLGNEYVAGQLQLSADPAIATSWLLWPQEEGIAPLAHAVNFEHMAPAAQRIDWQTVRNASGNGNGNNSGTLAFDLGRGQPAAMLLHASPQGWQLQTVSGGGLQGREQRAAWLQTSDTWYQLAYAAGAAALLTMAAGLMRRLKSKATP